MGAGELVMVTMMIKAIVMMPIVTMMITIMIHSHGQCKQVTMMTKIIMAVQMMIK